MKRDEKKPQPRPDDMVRCIALMRRDDRARVKYFSDRIGSDMEDLAARWILERLAIEEKKLAKQ